MPLTRQRARPSRARTLPSLLPTFRAARIPIVFVLALACYAAPPPPASPGDLSGCHPGSYGELSEHTCDTDGDCLLCASEEAQCGTLRTRSELALTNAPCPAPTSEACGAARAACCEGRCVRSLGPPPL